MAVDLQVCFPQETILVTKVTPVPGSTRMLSLVGEDFSAVDEVRVNDLPCPSYIVQSTNRMHAELPEGVAMRDVNAVTVLSRRLVLTSKSLLRFRISRMPSKTTGILRLVQLYVKTLLTRPGSDSFNPNYGGGLMRALGSTFSRGERNSLVNDAAIAVRSTNEQIIAIQARDPRLPLEEKLLTCTILSSTFSPDEAALRMELDLRNQTGNPAILNLVY